MASAVATPLERQFGRIAAVNEMTSVSQLGTTSITLQFDLGRDVNGAARDVQAAINAARAYLPSDLPSNPWYYKVNPADSPILILAMTSDELTQDQIYDAADSVISQKLSQVPGVGQVFIGGSSPPAVRIEANPTLLNKLGLGLARNRESCCCSGKHEPGKRQYRECRQAMVNYRQRPTQECEAISAHHNRVSRRRAGSPERRCRCGRLLSECL